MELANFKPTTLVAMANDLSDQLHDDNNYSIAMSSTQYCDLEQLFDTICKHIRQSEGDEYLVDNVIAKP